MTNGHDVGTMNASGREKNQDAVKSERPQKATRRVVSRDTKKMSAATVQASVPNK